MSAQEQAAAAAVQQTEVALRAHEDAQAQTRHRLEQRAALELAVAKAKFAVEYTAAEEEVGKERRAREEAPP